MLFLTTIVVLPGSARADDGTIEINATCAAVGCVAGDTPGFPVTLSGAGSYVLTSDLDVPAGQSGVTMSAAGASLDLNGFSIRGPVVCTGEPVTSCAGTLTGTGLTVGIRGRAHGGRIEGFGGSGVSAGTDARLYDLVIAHNGGSGVFASRGVSIERCTIVLNFLNGVSATSGGGYVEVSRSTVRGNRQNGVDASNGLIIQNRLQNNGLAGLQSITAGGDAAYALNSFDGNNSSGVQVVGGVEIGCNSISGTAVCP